MYKDSKSHYLILDALRGIAAIIVVFFHIFEVFANGDHTKLIINHGYLAVDFFFALSGFVIGYAYDDRWNSMNLKSFFKRRLIRLHPMIIIGMIIGALLYYFQFGPLFPFISETPVWKLLIVMLIGMTLLPLTPSMEIRGWTEMHPLNGPAWSLFFEYIANILYALWLRKLSNKWIATLAFIAGSVLIHMAVTRGDIIGGWALNSEQIYVGFTRLLYPFLAGLLLSRISKPKKLNNAFLWTTLILTIVLAIPRIGGAQQGYLNGIYDSLIVIVVFPILVYMGSCGQIVSDRVKKLATFLGNLSYPLYITHYPIMYIFMAWVARNELYVDPTSTDKLPQLIIASLATLITSILLGHYLFKIYDLPIRSWLTKKCMNK